MGLVTGLNLSGRQSSVRNSVWRHDETRHTKIRAVETRPTVVVNESSQASSSFPSPSQCTLQPLSEVNPELVVSRELPVDEPCTTESARAALERMYALNLWGSLASANLAAYVFSVDLQQKPKESPSRYDEKSPDYYANVGDAIRTLREDIPLLFAKDLNCEYLGVSSCLYPTTVLQKPLHAVGGLYMFLHILA
jgi:hypothetical protein